MGVREWGIRRWQHDHFTDLKAFGNTGKSREGYKREESPDCKGHSRSSSEKGGVFLVMRKNRDSGREPSRKTIREK